MADRSQTEEHEARRCLRVDKKFFHVEVADMLSCVIGYATSCVASNEGAVRAEPDWQKCKICDIRSLFCTGPISRFVVIIYYHLK